MGGKYYSLSEDMAAFNGIAELAPASSTASLEPTALHFSKGTLPAMSCRLSLGERVETCKIAEHR